MSEKKKIFIFSPKEQIGTIAVVMLSILLNVFGDYVARKYSLPAWLDSFGTVFAAYTLGPICGAIVGAAGNIILSFWDNISYAYALTSIFIGLIIGCVARKKYFESFFHAMSAAGAVTIISMSISTIINLLLLGGSTGNIWGDGVRDYLIFKGAPQTLSLAVGQLYLEFTDKLVTILGMYFFIKLVRFFRSFSPAAKNTTCLMIVCAVFCGTSISVSAESDTSYIRTIYNGDNGLECGHANDVAQTNDGILWVGSYSGLYRYNGNTFKFMNEFDLVKNVNCLFVDSEGRLWIGTNDNGVVVAINENIVYSMDSNGGLPSDSVRCITQGANGEYYIGTSDSMVIVRLKTDIYVDTVLDDIRYAKKAAADKNGNVAVVTADGKLHIFRNSKEVYEIKAESEGINFACCTFDPSGMLWVGTTDGTAIAFTVGENGAEKTAEIDCEGLSGVNSIYYQNDSVNWVLSDNGVGMILDKKEYMHLETEGFNYSLENMTIDYQGNLWIASSRMGLMRLSTSPFTDVFGDCGIEACVVNTTALKDDIMYVGTDNGLIIIDRKANKQVENKLTETLSEARIRCIKNDSNQRETFGFVHTERGLLRLNRTDHFYCMIMAITRWVLVCEFVWNFLMVLLLLAETRDFTILKTILLRIPYHMTMISERLKYLRCMK